MATQDHSARRYGVPGVHQLNPPAVEIGQFNAAAPQPGLQLSSDSPFPFKSNLNTGFVLSAGYATSSAVAQNRRDYNRLCLVASSDSTQNTLVSSGAVHDQSFPIGPHYPAVGNYENPNDAYGYAVQPQRANVRPFQSAPVVGTASAFFQPAPRRTESQLNNLFPQSFPNSQPEGSLNSYPPSPYSWRPSQPSIGSPASNSDHIQHEIRGSDVYLPVSSLGVYDHGLIAVGMGIFDGVPQRSDQASHEDALSERLPSADIPQAASPHGLDTAPIRRRRGRDELAIARRRKAPGQFACSHCGTATFTTKAAREKHIESLHLNTVYRCGIDGCPKAYAHQASLDRHRRDTHDTSKKRHGGAVD